MTLDKLSHLSTNALTLAFAAGLVLAFGWGVFRLVYQAVTKRSLPRTSGVLLVEALVKLLPDALGAVDKVLTARGAAPLFLPHTLVAALLSTDGPPGAGTQLGPADVPPVVRVPPTPTPDPGDVTPPPPPPTA